MLKKSNHLRIVKIVFCFEFYMLYAKLMNINMLMLTDMYCTNGRL